MQKVRISSLRLVVRQPRHKWYSADIPVPVVYCVFYFVHCEFMYTCFAVAMISSSRISLLLLLLLLEAGHVSGAAGFFIQGSSLTWYIPKKQAIHRPTHSITRKDKSPYNILSNTQVIDPRTGKECLALDNNLLYSASKNSIFPFFLRNQELPGRKALIVVMPQLGDFDSVEYAGLLKQVLPDLKRANIALRIIGIGNCKTAHMFSLFTGIPLECIRMDPTASVHSALQLHRGPNWDIPDWIPSGLLGWFAKDVCGNDNEKIPANEVTRAWLNYMAMCAGIAAPGTLAEILRGYLGDKSAPEMLSPEETVRVGPISIKGTTDVKIGPIQHQNWWKNEQGYLRPVELATVRLKSMVEVLTKFGDYVPDQRLLDWRGGTFLLDESCRQRGDKKASLYEHRNPGVLTYSETMARPLSFLESYIGVDVARNPWGLGDPDWEYLN